MALSRGQCLPVSGWLVSDKPCGGGGVVVAKNKPPAQVGADKVCSMPRTAEQIAKQKAQGVKLEALLDEIDTHSDSYEEARGEEIYRGRL